MQFKTVKKLTEIKHITTQYESSNKPNSIASYITKSHYIILPNNIQYHIILH